MDIDLIQRSGDSKGPLACTRRPPASSRERLRHQSNFAWSSDVGSRLDPSLRVKSSNPAAQRNTLHQCPEMHCLRIASSNALLILPISYPVRCCIKKTQNDATKDTHPNVHHVPTVDLRRSTPP